MELLKQLNDVMSYIEEHLLEEIDLKKAAKKALSSEYEFKRIFSFLSGMTLSEYIRKRRLTLAAMDLQKPDAKVIDTANKYNYTSPDAFSRAFQKFHGILPSDVKQHPQTLKACPMMTFRLTIQGGDEMEYRIVEKEVFQVLGIKKEMEMRDGELVPSYDAVMSEVDESLVETLETLSDTEPSGVIHVTVNYSEMQNGDSRFDHYIGAAVGESTASNEFEAVNVPSLTWAVFNIEGEWKEVDEHWQRIYSEWLPSSSYELVEGPEILASKDETSEIWIPVKKKN